MMIQNIQNLTLKLISLDTSPENQKNLYQALEYIQEELSEFDFQIYEKQGVKSILFYNIFPKDGHFSLILNSHLDIIPAKKEQFIPRIGEGKIFGAGALDMKWALACALYAFKTTAKNVSYPLAFQVVTDEEVGGYKGTKYQIESWISSDFVIATEPTNFDIVHKAKGVFQFEIITRGVTAHSAYPWRGKNAIQHMLEFMNRFQKRFKNPEQDMWETSYNFSQIQTPDYGYNKIPDICRLKIDMRYIQEERKARSWNKEFFTQASRNPYLCERTSLLYKSSRKWDTRNRNICMRNSSKKITNLWSKWNFRRKTLSKKCNRVLTYLSKYLSR